jgi:ABC-type transport system substrate-binding protein
MGLGAALLAACGGGDGGGSDGSTGKRDSSGLLSEPQDTSSSAKAGGVFKWHQSVQPNHFDGIAQGQAQLNVYNGMVYSSLVSNKMGIKQPSSFNEVVPELASSWELSPDRTTITFKLRDGVKWQNRNPVNGRAFDSSDVVATWTRYESLPSNNRAANSNTHNPNAPILSVTAPDARTIVYKLKEPASFLMQRLANMITGEAGTVQPREAGSTFDPRQDQIGTGGFMLEKYEPSVGLTYKRNPDHWNKDEPRIGTLEVPLIPEYATGLAALQSGQIYTFVVRPLDVVTTKRAAPGINMYQTLVATAHPTPSVGFGWQPWGSYDKSPWLDERVRQAMSLAFDRDIFIDTFLNVSTFEKEGLPVETYWHTAMGPIPEVWLDPRGKEFGPNATFYEQNVTEAKRLLTAAGFPNGVEYNSYFVEAAPFGPTYNNEVEVLDGWARDAGFKPTPVGLNYNIDYLQRYITQQGKHDGVLHRAGAVSSPDPVDFFVWRYWSKSGPTSGSLGLGVNGPSDPAVDSFIERAKAEFDVKKQASIIHDMQRHLAKTQYCVSRCGQASTFDLAWPAAANFRVFYNDSRAINNHYYTTWVDDTKAPIARS